MLAAAERLHGIPAPSGAVPKGPTGLWAALVRVDRSPLASEFVGGAEVIELASVAHLGYLARLAPNLPVAVEAPGAEVTDLALYRARRSA